MIIRRGVRLLGGAVAKRLRSRSRFGGLITPKKSVIFFLLIYMEEFRKQFKEKHIDITYVIAIGKV